MILRVRLMKLILTCNNTQQLHSNASIDYCRQTARYPGTGVQCAATAKEKDKFAAASSRGLPVYCMRMYVRTDR